MLGYVNNALHQFIHVKPKNPQYPPYPGSENKYAVDPLKQSWLKRCQHYLWSE